MEYVLRTDKLTKCFGDKKAVNKVSMQIKKGDIYGFIGKNGAGKTTLMRLVLGVAEPSDGRITLFNGLPVRYSRNNLVDVIVLRCLFNKWSWFLNLLSF